MAILFLLLATRLAAQGEGLLEQARALAAKGDPGGAEAVLFQYIQAKPRDALGYGQLARLLFTKGDYQRAGNFATAALSYNADYPEALIVQGQIFIMQSRTVEAQKLLERAIELDSNNAEAYFQLGILFDRGKRHAEAAAHFEKAVALRPDDPRAWDYLALSLEPLGQMEKADAAYRKGLAANKGKLQDSFLDYNYGRFLMKQNRLTESKQRLDQALRVAAKTRAVHYEHGKLNLLLKNYQEARVDAERALALPDASGVILDLQVYYLLTTVYRRLGEEALARKYAELSRTTPVPVQR